MNNNYYCVFDYETAGLDPTRCQLTQIGAMILHPRSLKLVDSFSMYCRPELDEAKAMALSLDPVADEALEVTKTRREDLVSKPSEKMVFQKFSSFIKKYTKGTNLYAAPIPCGYNIINYDLIITNRLCNMYGPQAGLFNRMFTYDLFHHFKYWTENDPEVVKHTLSDCARWMGIPESELLGTHEALQDVKITANCIVKLLHYARDINNKFQFAESFRSAPMLIK